MLLPQQVNTYSRIFRRRHGAVLGLGQVGKAEYCVPNELRVGGLDGLLLPKARVHVKVGGPEAADIDIGSVASAVAVVPAEVFQKCWEAEELLLFMLNDGVVLYTPFCDVA